MQDFPIEGDFGGVGDEILPYGRTAQEGTTMLTNHDLGAELQALSEEAAALFRERLQFQFDHATPIAWTPRAHRLANIVCCCSLCNLLKGQANGEDFRRLLLLLDDIDPRAATDIRRRLTSGGRRYAGGTVGTS
jgi:hypothetical protein